MIEEKSGKLTGIVDCKGHTMSSPMQTLQPWNTFRLAAKANCITVISSVELLCKSWQSSWQKNEPVLLLGEGSNVLFLQDFTGQVIINRIKGINVRENDDAWLVHVGAGESWHQLVEFTLEKGIAGLENLAMIPGCAGSAPIQNIGAYGVELDQVCDYVDVVHLPDGKQQRLLASECEFGYRDSVFKHQYRHYYAIISIGLKLKKTWSPVLTYGDLTRLNVSSVTPREVFDAICHMRSSKLPSPAVTGNAGSFFKNPLVTAEQARKLHDVWPSMPCYPQRTGQVKLAAGWLIEQCQLKGFRSGGAAVHQQQALVLINVKNATGQDVVALAHEIRERVGAKFNVWLEPEVRFIGAEGEMDAVEVIA